MHKAPRGFSTIELLIAFSVAIIMLTGIMQVAFGGQTAGLDSMVGAHALSRAFTQIGDATHDLAVNWNTNPSPQTDISDTYQDLFDPTKKDLTKNIDGSRTNTVADVSPCSKTVNANINWKYQNNRTNTGISYDTVASNINIAKALGDCDPTPSGDWDNPENAGWEVTPSAFTGQGTGIDMAFLGGKPYAIITGEQTGANKKDVMVVDLSNASNPTVVGQKDIVPNGYNGVVVSGHYAYVIQNDTVNQLQVLDLSAPNNPTLVAQISIPNTTNAIARSIAYYNNYIYIGTQYVPCPPGPPCTSTQNNEFHVFDVSTPTSPQPKGSLNINHNINGIFVQGKYAYLATSDDTGELMIVDVSDPTAMIHPDISGMKFNPSGNFDGTSIYVLGAYAYLGRAGAGVSDFDFYKVNISNPISLTAGKWKRIGDDINGVVVRGRFAFLITSGKDFQVWDIASGPNSQIVKVSTCINSINGPNKFRGLVYYNDLLYTVSENQATLNTFHDKASTCP